MRIALEDLLASMQTEWYRDSLNDALRKEFETQGVPADEIDFFEIIQKAVLSRVHPRDADYDDLFQEVAINLLDRTKAQGLKKEWVAQAKQMHEDGRLHSFGGWLFRSAKNLVKDLHDSLLNRQRRQTHFDTPNDDEPSGVDIERYLGDSITPEESVSAEDLYQNLKDALHDERSKRILDIIIDKGIRGFLRGKGISELARELDTSPAMASYYRDKVFKPDLLRALRKLGDRDLIERVQEVFASAKKHPRAQLALEIDRVNDELEPHGL